MGEETPPPLRGYPSKRDTVKQCAIHGEHGHYTNNCNAWKRHLKELVGEGHCTEFVAKKATEQIEDRDAVAKEPPQKVIQINNILADSQGRADHQGAHEKDRAGDLCFPSHNRSTSDCGYTHYWLPKEGLDRA